MDIAVLSVRFTADTKQVNAGFTQVERRLNAFERSAKDKGVLNLSTNNREFDRGLTGAAKSQSVWKRDADKKSSILLRADSSSLDKTLTQAEKSVSGFAKRTSATEAKLTASFDGSSAERGITDLERKGRDFSGQTYTANLGVDGSGVDTGLTGARADLSGFAGQSYLANLGADNSGVTSALNESNSALDQFANRQTSNASIGVSGGDAALGEISGLGLSLDEIAGRTATATADADTGGATAKLQVLDTAVDAMDGRNINMDVDVDTGGATASLLGFVSLAGLASASTSSLGFQVLQGSSSFIFFAAAAAAAGSAVVPLLGGVFALAGAGAAAGSAMGLLGGAIYVFTKGLYDGGAGMEALSARASVLGNELVQAIGPATLMFDEMGIAALDVASNYVPLIGAATWNMVAAAMPAYQRFLDMLASTATYNNISTIFQAGIDSIGPLINAVANLSVGMIALFAAAAPYASMFFEWLSRITNQFRMWAQSDTGVATITGAIEVAIPVFQALWNMVVQVGGALWNFGINNAGTLVPILNFLTSALVMGINAFSWLAQTVGPVGIIIGALVPVIVAVISVLAAIAAPILSVISFFGGASAIVTAFGAVLSFLFSPVMLIIGAIGLLAFAAYQIYQHWGTIGPWMSALWSSVYTTVSGWVSAIWTFITTTFSAIGTGIVAAWTSISTGAAYYWNLIWMTVSTWATAVYTAVVTWISGAATAIYTAWTTAWTYTTTVWNSIWTTIVSIVSYIYTSISTWITAAATVIYTAWTTAWTYTSTLWNSIWTAVVSAVTWIYNSILSWLTSAANFIYTIWSTAWSYTSDLWNQMWSIVESLLSYIWSSINSWLTSAVNTIYSWWSTAYDYTSSLWNSIWSFLDSIWSSIYDTTVSWITYVYDYVVSTWDSTYSYTSEIFNSIWTFLGDTWSGIYDTVTSWLSDLWSYIEYAWDGILSGAESFGSWLTDVLDTGIGNAIGAAGDLLSTLLSAVSWALDAVGDPGGWASTLSDAAGWLDSIGYAEGGIAFATQYQDGGLGTQAQNARMHVWNEGMGNEAFIAQRGPRRQNLGYLNEAASWFGMTVAPGPMDDPHGTVHARGFCDGGMAHQHHAQGGYVSSSCNCAAKQPEIAAFQLGGTHYNWDAPTEQIKDAIGEATGWCGTPNTYYGHAYIPGATEEQSVDWWSGGRGGYIDYACGSDIWSEGSAIPSLTYQIYQGTHSALGAFPEDPHYDHVHQTFAGAGMGGLCLINLRAQFEKAWEAAKGVAHSAVGLIGQDPPTESMASWVIDNPIDTKVQELLAMIPACGGGAAGDCGAVAQAAVESYGWGDASCFASLLQQESSCDPSAENPSGAAGIAQMKPSTFAAYDPGCGDIWDANCNALASLAYQYDVYGAPVCNAPYALGGTIPGRRGEGRTITAHAGEAILPVGVASNFRSYIDTQDDFMEVLKDSGDTWSTLSVRLQRTTGTNTTATAATGAGGGNFVPQNYYTYDEFNALEDGIRRALYESGYTATGDYSFAEDYTVLPNSYWNGGTSGGGTMGDATYTGSYEGTMAGLADGLDVTQTMATAVRDGIEGTVHWAAIRSGPMDTWIKPMEESIEDAMRYMGNMPRGGGHGMQITYEGGAAFGGGTGYRTPVVDHVAEGVKQGMESGGGASVAYAYQSSGGNQYVDIESAISEGVRQASVSINNGTSTVHLSDESVQKISKNILEGGAAASLSEPVREEQDKIIANAIRQVISIQGVRN